MSQIIFVEINYVYNSLCAVLLNVCVSTNSICGQSAPTDATLRSEQLEPGRAFETKHLPPNYSNLQHPQFVLKAHTLKINRNAGESVYGSCPAHTVPLCTVRWGYFCSCALFFLCALASAWMTLNCHICVEGDHVAAVCQTLPGILLLRVIK